MTFLIDTGADVLIIPPTDNEKRKNIKTADDQRCYLFAANGTRIDTYGQRNITLNFGLRRKFDWPFTIANVTRAIIGADFLKHYGLMVDLQNVI